MIFQRVLITLFVFGLAFQGQARSSNRVKKSESPVHFSGDSLTSDFQSDQKVMIEWHGKWYKGKVLEVIGEDEYQIHYDGYDSNWDEVVSQDRLRVR